MTTDNNGPYGIGTTTWPGLAKVLEECGEVIQVLSKLVAKGDLDHTWEQPDGTSRGWGDLTQALHEELGDLLAALGFFCEANPEIDRERVNRRMLDKQATFRSWHGEATS